MEYSKLRRLMEREKFDILIASSPENIFYMSRFCAQEPTKTPCSVVISKEGERILLTPKSEEGFIPKDCPVKDQRFYGRFYVERSLDVKAESEDFIKAVSEIMRDVRCKGGRIGVEKRHLPSIFYERLRKTLPKADFYNADKIFDEMRIIKCKREIERIKKVVGATERALQKTYEEVRNGISELELATKLKIVLLEEGAESVFVELGAGLRSGFPTYPSKYKIKRGDVIHIDVAAREKQSSFASLGYCSDIARNAVFEEPTEKQRRVHEAVLRGQQKAIEAIKPEVRISEIFKIGQETVRKSGYPQFWRHHIGHGIGLEPHEAPKWIDASNHQVLEAGMVICIEIPYYIANFGGFNIEDVVLVTKDGYELLSTLDRSLYILP